MRLSFTALRCNWKLLLFSSSLRVQFLGGGQRHWGRLAVSCKISGTSRIRFRILVHHSEVHQKGTFHALRHLGIAFSISKYFRNALFSAGGLLGYAPGTVRVIGGRPTFSGKVKPDGYGYELVFSVRALLPQKFSIEEELMHVKQVEVKSPHVGVM
ncbi:hypothetical protein TNCV_235221 [Trichonephila clavipes]|uniref:Peptidylprolyl isomerase n=1 Tax=Trichonephila clavipes TaxID=2585209 RepID=A0A8X6SJQ3_TRICX|nr:hypothetical protein TNCV_235221 [Trichonephila clavipes]